MRAVVRILAAGQLIHDLLHLFRIQAVVEADGMMAGHRRNLVLLHATTILAVRKDGRVAIAGDGQVTLGQNMIMKHGAQKVRRLYDGKVLAGFAGATADAFTLFELFEAKLKELRGNMVTKLRMGSSSLRG